MGLNVIRNLIALFIIVLFPSGFTTNRVDSGQGKRDFLTAANKLWESYHGILRMHHKKS